MAVKKLLIWLFVFLGYAGARAQVPPDMAKTAAVNWMKHLDAGKSIADIDTLIAHKHKGRICSYMVVFGPVGWVLVSASIDARPVIAYGVHTLMPIGGEAPPAFGTYMQQANTQVQLARESKTLNQQARQQWKELLEGKLPVSKADGIGPLLYTQWGQGCTYNDTCPVDSSGTCYRTLTGCAATAMSQLFQFHNYPERGTGNKTYTGSYKTHSVDFSSQLYEWHDMPGKNHEESSPDPRVPQAIYHCGVSCNMTYTVGGSGTNPSLIEPAVEAHWDYTASFRQRILPFLWNMMLTNELDNYRPVFMSGYNDSGGGHAFVCDGYQGSNYFHFNWGWEGRYDGYFYTDDLSVSGVFDWTNTQLAVTMTPNRKIELVAEPTLPEENKIAQGQETEMSYDILSSGEHSWTGSLYLCLLDSAGNHLQCLDSLSGLSIAPGDQQSISFSNVVINEEMGSYQLELRYRLSDSPKPWTVYKRGYDNPVRFDLTQPPPTITAEKSLSDNEIGVQWEQTGAPYYQVCRSSPPYQGSTCFSWISDTFFVDTAVSPGIQYIYTVKAADGPSGENASPQSAPDTGWLVFDTPTLSSASLGLYAEGIKLEWSTSHGADYYEIQRSLCTGGSTWDLIAQASGTDYTDTTTLPGQCYAYRVVAVGLPGDAHRSHASNSMEGWAKHPLTDSLQASDGTSTSHVQINWAGVAQAREYYLEASPTASFDSLCQQKWLSATSYMDQAASPGQYYYYRVIATSDSLMPTWDSLPTDSGYVRLVKPLLRQDSITGMSVIVNWDSIDGAACYSIWRNTVNNPYTASNISGMVKGLQYEDNDTQAGGSYYYWALAHSQATNGTQSDYSTVLYCSAIIPAPVITAQYLQAVGLAYISWSRIDGAGYYKLYRSLTPDSTQAVAVSAWTSNTYYEDFDLDHSNTHYYWLIAAADTTSGIYSPYSQGASISFATNVPDAPHSTAVITYPNPTDGKLYIESEANIDKIEVYKQSKLVTTFATPDGTGLDLSGLTTGVYILRIYSSQSVVVRKVSVFR